MTDTQQQAGIRNRIYLGGKFFTRDPVPVQVTIQRYEAKTRVSNLSLRLDRPQTTAGLPNVRNRHEFLLPWVTMVESPLLEHLDSLAAVGQPFDLGLWKQVTDIWDGDGSTTTFLMQRRQILPAVTPPVEWEDYPTQVFVLDRPYGDPDASVTTLTVVPKTSGDIFTGDPSTGEAWVESDGHSVGGLYVSTIRLADAPPDEYDCLVAIYLPLYKVVIDQEVPRNYSANLIEPRGFKLLEA